MSRRQLHLGVRDSIAVVRKRSYRGLEESAWIGVIPTVSGWIGFSGQTTQRSSSGSMVGVTFLGRPLDDRRVVRWSDHSTIVKWPAWVDHSTIVEWFDGSSSGLLGPTTRRSLSCLWVWSGCSEHVFRRLIVLVFRISLSKYLKIEIFMKNFPEIVSLTIDFEITIFDPTVSP